MPSLMCQYHCFFLKSCNSDARCRHASVLGKLGDSAAIPYLIEAFRDSEDYVCRSIVSALSKFGDDAIPPLLNAVADKNEYVRRYAIEALGELKSEAALNTLHSLFTSNLDQEKVAIAEALGNIGDVSSIPLLNDLDENSSIFLKCNVQNAYSAIGSKNPQSIIENLKHPSVQVRRRTDRKSVV